MTFNEGMQIDTSTTSTGGGGRGPGRGIAVGGGGLGLIVLVVALFLGVDPSTVMPEQGAPGAEAEGFDTSQCRTGADANRIAECRVIATANSLDGIWPQLLPDYTRPRVKLFTGQVNTACGAASSEVGPFYCPGDQTAYFDVGFFDVLKDQFGSSGGPLAQEYVVAHEFGHHVQQLQGSLVRAQQDPEGPTGGGVRTELQADCYAGVWAHYAAITKQPGTDVTYLQPLTDKDIADALSAASAVGDDRIQEAATGRVNPEAWTHGSSEQRQKWFTEGYRTGDPASCDTFAATDLG
ncbi:neutral zinc metallopeptidase [Mycobacterium sp. CPCC 205372]|uniref:Neutral zinc metallopeptidase n=2 Tax=Mycobacteriaceae TaxID=1762 RepID=A0A9X2YKB1_9MYCO|nr:MULTISPECIES: neutral zinc metallopeptidase [Mycobacteriaceae]MCV7168756.1 neutral zinc metallopeptidase [[Mycobacterium] manitobense]MCZ8379498.1 neutral zinc metallopeptidase [Mycobacterium hippophais]